MTHPTEPNIRERLARALASNRLPAINLSAEAREDLIQQFLYHAQSDVDAILAELQEPSEGMLEKPNDFDCDVLRGVDLLTADDASIRNWFWANYRAMIRHIRDGGK